MNFFTFKLIVILQIILNSSFTFYSYMYLFTFFFILYVSFQFQCFVRFPVGDRTNNLLKVTINLVSQSICNESYGYDTKLPRGIVNELQICAGENGKDTCQVTLSILFIIADIYANLKFLKGKLEWKLRYNNNCNWRL